MSHNSLRPLALCTLAGALFAQTPAPATGGASSGGAVASPGGSRTPGTVNTPTNPFPGTNNNNTNRFPSPTMENRPIFIQGKVLLEDGTPPPESVTIERICGAGRTRTEGYTDSKGRFSFQLGQNNMVLADASSDSFGSGGGFGQPNSRGVSERELQGCELRAVLPGYRSQPLSMMGRRVMDNPDVGIIYLKRLGDVQGLTISATSALAPKDAQKAYEKGREQAKKHKLPEAEALFNKAIEIYPKYAMAWFSLGLLMEETKRPADAQKAYEQALAADSRLVPPYIQMAGLNAQRSEWQATADTASRAIKLNPYDFPRAYFLNAVANLNLQHFDAAETNAREGIKQDTRKMIPQLQHVLGMALAQKKDYAGAAKVMKSYLQESQPGPNMDLVRKQLAEVERLQGEASSASTGATPAGRPE